MERADLLVELGVEEMPASVLESATRQFSSNLVEGLLAERLAAEPGAIWFTPRRMIVAVNDIPVRQEDLVETVTGPPTRVAFDTSGNPTRAALAFAEKGGVPLSKVARVKTPKGEYLSLTRRQKGETTLRVLQRILPAAIKKIQFPKTMVWSPDKFRFVRPLRWIVTIFGGRVVRFSIADVVSSKYTSGHRSEGRPKIAVQDLASLRDLLRENGVVADPVEREAVIRTGLQRAAAAAGGRVLEDEDLLAAVVNLNEDPSVVCGAFDRRFLDLPKEILITVMREHQKYFSVLDEGGNLLPAFLAVINLRSDPGGNIRSGHERVLRARFADAEFFWQTDRKTPLADREPTLRNVLFQQKLGSYFDKVQRILALLPKVASALGCAHQLQEMQTAARLLKCDLVTEMVKEFTDLQGIVGGLYARAEGYPESVWRSVYEQYMPKTTDSPSPSTSAAAALSLTDRLDTVCGCFAVGLIPSGSRDPFAVRRQGNGILKILLDHGFHASMSQLTAWGLEALESAGSETSEELKRFFDGRLRFLFEEKGYGYDSINAVMAVACDDPVDAAARLAALEQVRHESDFLALAAGFKRVMNILGQSEPVTGDPDPGLMTEPAEIALWQRYQEVRPAVEQNSREHRHDRVLHLMASLRNPVDTFFDQVLVMAENDEVRRNRHVLLHGLARLFLSVADISQMVVERPAASR